MAVPPLAVIPRSVTFPMEPPSTKTGPPQVSPTPMALPALPPLLTSPIATAPPLAEAVATPPLPAEAVSVNCISLRPPCGSPRSPSTLIRALPGPKPVRRCAAQSSRFWRDLPSRLHLTGNAEKFSSSRIAHRFTSLGDCACYCPSPVGLPTSDGYRFTTGGEREPPEPHVCRTLTAKPLRGFPLSVSASADERNVVAAAARIRDGDACLLAELDRVGLGAHATNEGATTAAVRVDGRDRTLDGTGDVGPEIIFLRLRDLRANSNRASRTEQARDTTIVHDRSTFPSARRTANGFQRLAEPPAFGCASGWQCLGVPLSHRSEAAGEKPLNPATTDSPAYSSLCDPLFSETLWSPPLASERAVPSSSPKSRLLVSNEMPARTVPPSLSVAMFPTASATVAAMSAPMSCANACCTGATPTMATARPTDGTPITRTRRARPINPVSSRFFMLSTSLPATPQATRDYQRSAEPPGLNPDSTASGVPRATLSSDPAGVNRGSPRVALPPRNLGQQVSLSVSNVRVGPDVSSRNVRSDAVASRWRPSPEGDLTVPALPIPALTPDEMSRVDHIMGDDFGVTVLQLMEVAGRAVAAWARERFLGGDARGKTVLVLAGSGGNGGDGMVAARFLHSWGSHPAVWLSHEAANLQAAA